LPSGILHPYPHQNEPLFRKIIEAGGALISGFAPDARMQKGFFHARNRWIAAISDVTLIIEAQRKSGSYLTAKLALEEGRSICTLPVSPMSARGLGNLDLIEAGAQPLRDAQDLITFVERESRLQL
jgi:DNA processing protein